MTKHLYLLATIKTLDLSFCAGDRLVISEEYRRPTRKKYLYYRGSSYIIEIVDKSHGRWYIP